MRKTLSLMFVFAMAVFLSGTAVASADSNYGNGNSWYDGHNYQNSWSDDSNDDDSNYKETFTTHLTSGEEVPPTNSSGYGDMVVHVTDDEQELHYELSAYNLTSSVTGAHLHCASRGHDGPVVVPLKLPASHTEGVITQADVKMIGQQCNPNIHTLQHVVQAMREGQIYANVHTSKYPNGEIRGQLMLNNNYQDNDDHNYDNDHHDYNNNWGRGGDNDYDMNHHDYSWNNNNWNNSDHNNWNDDEDDNDWNDNNNYWNKDNNNYGRGGDNDWNKNWNGTSTHSYNWDNSNHDVNKDDHSWNKDDNKNDSYSWNNNQNDDHDYGWGGDNDDEDDNDNGWKKDDSHQYAHHGDSSHHDDENYDDEDDE
jgi:hypothetical protein